MQKSRQKDKPCSLYDNQIHPSKNRVRKQTERTRKIHEIENSDSEDEVGSTGKDPGSFY